MALPRQPFALNKFSTSVSQCPANPDAIRAIVIQRNNLTVVNGASTEMELVLSNFYSTVNTTSKITLTLPPHGGTALPIELYKFNEDEDQIKFLAVLPSYGTVSNTNEYIEWTTLDSIDSGSLYNEPAIGPLSLEKSFDINKVNCLQFGWGTNLSYTGGTGPIWMGTDGGLIKWDGSNMKLWSTFNSACPSDFINTIEVDPKNNLWLGTTKGVSYFNETSNFSRIYNSENSQLLSDSVNDVKLLSTDKLVIATDMGMSIFNYVLDKWESFDIYSTPELFYNSINKVAINNSDILLGTTGGIFMYDSATLTWNANPYNSDNTPGWNAPNDIKSLAVYGTDVYAGTTGGLVVFSYLGGSAQTIVAGASGPNSSNITSLRVVKYGALNQLYVGHDDGISIFDIGSQTWGFKVGSTSNSTLTDVTDVLPDFLSGIGTTFEGKTIFYGNKTTGLNKLLTSGPIFSVVPESNKSTNLLLKYPGDNLSLYSVAQPLYFLFSKPMTTTSFQQNVVLKDALTSSTCGTYGATVSGSWTWEYNNKLAKFTPSESLELATPYTLTISRGSTASDSSYLKENSVLQFYTENIIPECGWIPLGKLMILTGTNDHYIKGLYLRNPQQFSVSLSILVGTI